MAKKVRVYELARELHLSSEALVTILRGMDVAVKSHMSTVDEETVAKTRERLSKQREAVKKDTERTQKVQAEVQRKKKEEKLEEPRVSSPKPTPATPRASEPAPASATSAPPSPSKASPPPATRPQGTRPAGGTQQRPAPATRPDVRGGGTPPGRRRGGRKRRQIDQAAVQKNVKDTLATMGGGKGRRRRKEARDEVVEVPSKVSVTEFITLGELANLFRSEPTELIKHCFTLGIMANINKRLDRDVIELLADEFDIEVEFESEYGTDVVEDLQEDESSLELESRSPVITIMGHVDHGKTSLLDYIRRTQVAAAEAGGITQHIAAYEVEVPKGRMVFLDTPGHSAFTAMRARGAEVTDIVVIVVAADDSVMPQTVEAINHAKAANVPILVAVNKCDLPAANPQKVRQDISQHGLVPEDWGGDTVFVDLSAKSGEGVDALLDMILLVAEMKDLKASPARLGRGVVVEAHVDRGRGTVATILIQDGSVHVGDAFVCGAEGGKVRAIYDDRGRPVKTAGPAKPVGILGWSGLPNAGDSFQALRDEHQAREIVLKRQQLHREQTLRRAPGISLGVLSEQVQAGEMQDLNLIVKGDTQGSVEVLCDSFEKLSGDEVRVRIVHRGVGNINESDVLLAAASKALIFGFHVKSEPKAQSTAEREAVDINLYEVIYEAVNNLTLAVEGLLKPEEVERQRGRAEVRQVFRVPKGVIAGCYVSTGSVKFGASTRVIRDGEVVFTGTVESLKRFKDDVKQVDAGLECGIGIKNFNNINAGDELEFFETEQVLRKIS